MWLKKMYPDEQNLSIYECYAFIFFLSPSSIKKKIEKIKQNKKHGLHSVCSEPCKIMYVIM